MKIDSPTPEQIPALVQMWTDAFGDYDGYWAMFLETGFVPEHCRCLSEGEKLYAALYWFDGFCQGQKMAYLYAVVTHPDHRGKGFCRLLMEDTHNRLAEQGYSASLLLPEREGLRQMYRKMGYADCTFVSEFTCAPGTAVSLEAIGPGEYAARRRQCLSQGGVIQEGKNLDFLAAQVQFYAGTDVLLAAYTDGDTLNALELLGDPQAAPGIVAALGCRQGHFRMPGAQTPFAMYHPLVENAAVPQYFGFAFD